MHVCVEGVGGGCTELMCLVIKGEKCLEGLKSNMVKEKLLPYDFSFKILTQRMRESLEVVTVIKYFSC